MFVYKDAGTTGDDLMELTRFIELVESDEVFEEISDGNEKWRFALMLNDKLFSLGVFHEREDLDIFMLAFEGLRNSNTGKWGSIVAEVAKD